MSCGRMAILCRATLVLQQQPLSTIVLHSTSDQDTIRFAWQASSAAGLAGCCLLPF